jgi:transposase
MAVVMETGEVVYETRVETTREALRRAVGSVTGPKRVVYEEGPLSAMIHDALKDVAEEVISCDPTRNALIATAEDSSDERDARRLAMLHRLGATHRVHVVEEPYRTLRSLVHHDYKRAQDVTRVKNQIKALFRRWGIRVRGAGVYRSAGRKEMRKELPRGRVRWQLDSLGRLLDAFRLERLRAQRMIAKQARPIDAVKRLKTIPTSATLQAGMGPKTTPAIVAWIAGPERFKSRNALSSYAGLGLKQDVTHWEMVGHAHASKRGNRELKRALLLAARGALKGTSALRRRYDARREAGWEDRKAIRDIARTILFIACAIWQKRREYDQVRYGPQPSNLTSCDAKVKVPVKEHGAR